MKYSTHKQYYNTQGIEVPSVTTIISLLAKPALSKWANIMGFRKRSVDDILMVASTIGTLMHQCIELYLRNEKFSLKDEFQEHRNTLLKRLDGFVSWLGYVELEPEFLEKEVVSEKFGGTVDFYGSLDGKKVILDFKTSSRVYSSMFLQLAAYAHSIEEQGYEVDGVGIVHVTEKGTKLHYKSREEIEKYINVFITLADMFHGWYEINKEDGWGNICDKC